MLKKRRQALEEYILAFLEDLGYRGTAGSGNKLGDGDVKPRSIQQDKRQFGFECNARNDTSHSVATADWNKAKLQIQLLGLSPVFVTRNSAGEVLVHLKFEEFFSMMEELEEKQ